MKHLPKSTPTEILNDPYGFTYKEMSEVIGENEAKALYEELYKQLPRKKNLSMLVKNICKSSDTEKYVYELKDNKYIETVLSSGEMVELFAWAHKSVVLLVVFFVSPGEMALFVI